MQAQIALKVLHHLHLLCRPRAIKSAFKWDIVGSLSLRTYLKTNQLLSINSALWKFFLWFTASVLHRYVSSNCQRKEWEKFGFNTVSNGNVLLALSDENMCQTREGRLISKWLKLVVHASVWPAIRMARSASQCGTYTFRRWEEFLGSSCSA